MRGFVPSVVTKMVASPAALTVTLSEPSGAMSDATSAGSGWKSGSGVWATRPLGTTTGGPKGTHVGGSGDAAPSVALPAHPLPGSPSPPPRGGTSLPSSCTPSGPASSTGSAAAGIESSVRKPLASVTDALKTPVGAQVSRSTATRRNSRVGPPAGAASAYRTRSCTLPSTSRAPRKRRSAAGGLPDELAAPPPASGRADRQRTSPSVLTLTEYVPTATDSCGCAPPGRGARRQVACTVDTPHAASTNGAVKAVVAASAERPPTEGGAAAAPPTE